jgi:hypothetical protein
MSRILRLRARQGSHNPPPAVRSSGTAPAVSAPPLRPAAAPHAAVAAAARPTPLVGQATPPGEAARPPVRSGSDPPVAPAAADRSLLDALEEALLACPELAAKAPDVVRSARAMASGGGTATPEAVRAPPQRLARALLRSFHAKLDNRAKKLEQLTELVTHSDWITSRKLVVPAFSISPNRWPNVVLKRRQKSTSS